MLMPRKVMHRKQHRAVSPGRPRVARRLTSATSRSKHSSPLGSTARQIEAARIAMTRHVSVVAKSGSGSFRQAHHAKPAETRMGSGKGNPEHWVAVCVPVESCSSCRASTRRSRVRRWNVRSKSSR